MEERIHDLNEDIEVTCFGQEFNPSTFAIAKADMMIIGGTSLAVYPAAGLIQYFNGENLVVINKGQTQRSTGAKLTIDAPIGQVLNQIVVR